jgi:hypothetical protein
MTEEQIFELASKYLELHPIHGDVSVWDEWCGKPEDLLKFALAIHEDGYNKGYDRGCEDGYESAKVSTEMNTWSEDDD